MSRKIKKVKKGFNQQQLEVIDHLNGPCLVMAVAGAGKTTAATERIGKLVEGRGIWPSQILAMTFTKDAATAMKEKLEKKGINIDAMQVSTFHSFCRTLVLAEGPSLPKYNVTSKLNLDISGEASRGLIRHVIGYQNLNWRGASVNDIEVFISSCKNRLIKPSEVDASKDGLLFKQTYELYERERNKRKFFTFDDLIFIAWQILSENKSILTKWQKKFRYVIVDEYQDTNPAQNAIIELIALPENNLMVVGDDDQSIYGWRDAVPEFMINFSERFPTTKIIRMEKNYRCGKLIGALANPLISNNVHRLKKELQAEKEHLGTVGVSSSIDFEEEAIAVMNYIQKLEEYTMGDFGQITILYRTNAQSRAFEDLFTQNDIPYTVVGGGNFYDRKEIKDIMGYIFAAFNFNDKADESLERIYNIPYRKLGKRFKEDLDTYRERNKLSFEEAIRDIPLSGFDQKQVDSLLNIVDGIKSRKKLHPELLLQWLVDEIDYGKYIAEYDGGSDTENNRFDNVNEFIRASAKFKTVEEYFTHINKIRTKKKKKTKNKVVFSTIHRAKGLEWKNVIIVGCNELILPHARSMHNDLLIEEERRLMYVALTRAQFTLLFSYVTTAAVAGGIRDLPPSRFLLEIPQIYNIIMG